MEENLYTPNCIRTYSGHYINPFDPDPSKICIEDIAQALSQIPRFNGHLKNFFSVAQHCLDMVNTCKYEISDNQMYLTILLHDATEAYLLDLPKPLKNNLPGYREAEDNLYRVIADKYGLIYPLPNYVKELDKMALEWEWANLMLGNWDYPVMDFKIVKKRFIETFKKFFDCTCDFCGDEVDLNVWETHEGVCYLCYSSEVNSGEVFN